VLKGGKMFMYQIKIVTYLHTTKKIKHYKSISGNEFISHLCVLRNNFFLQYKNLTKRISAISDLNRNKFGEWNYNRMKPNASKDCRTAHSNY